LKKYNEFGFINIISRFKNTQFFTCSSLGHVENGQFFTPLNVEEPIYWILSKTSRVIEKVVK
jgi:hypothetical protein